MTLLMASRKSRSEMDLRRARMAYMPASVHTELRGEERREAHGRAGAAARTQRRRAAPQLCARGRGAEAREQLEADAAVHSHGLGVDLQDVHAARKVGEAELAEMKGQERVSSGSALTSPPIV